MNAALFCADVGWRKPALPIFQATAKALGVEAGACVFVGDDPRWDVHGAQAAGMVPVLVDRTGRYAGHGGWLIHGLGELPALLQRL